MNTKIILEYLSALSRNNNREWYHEHRYGKLENLTVAFCITSPKTLLLRLYGIPVSVVINYLIIPHSVPIFLLKENDRFLLDIIL